MSIKLEILPSHHLNLTLFSESCFTGISGFYKGWFPALVQKIPSYALTWMFFQQIKLVRQNDSLSLFFYFINLFLHFIFLFFIIFFN